MDLHTTFGERVIHLLLYTAAGIWLGVAGFAGLERLAGEGRRAVRVPHMAGVTVALAALFAAERLYHALL